MGFSLSLRLPSRLKIDSYVSHRLIAPVQTSIGLQDSVR
jgi:hypothetical protein